MSAKIIGPYKLLDGVSLGATVNSTGLDVTRLIYASIAVEWSGTPTGTLTIEVKNGDSPWIASSFTQSLSGASGTKMFDFALLPWEQLRIAYARTSGTGFISAHLLAKGW